MEIKKTKEESLKLVSRLVIAYEQVANNCKENQNVGKGKKNNKNADI